MLKPEVIFLLIVNVDNYEVEKYRSVAFDLRVQAYVYPSETAVGKTYSDCIAEFAAGYAGPVQH